MRRISKRVESIPRSGIRVILDMAQRPGVIHLEIGQPDFPTPRHIVEAAHRAAAEGRTGYTPNAGTEPLRRLIAEKLVRENHIHTSWEDITVTIGAMGALHSSFQTVLEPGDEVLVPDPGYPNYGMAALLCGAKTVPYPLDAGNGYQPDIDALERAAGSGVKAIVVNSPSNPTGAVISEEAARRIVGIAEERDLYVISDECYEKILFDGIHVSPAAFDRSGRCITVNSFSKSYAMTGWRVGYAATPPDLSPMFVKLQETAVACAPSISQAAAEEALRGPQECVAEMVESYRERRDLALGILKEHGLYRYTPGGAFYLLIDASGWKGDTYSLAKAILAETDVAVAPGETFGAAVRPYIRISLAAKRDLLEEGLHRICGFLNAIPPDSSRFA